MKDRVIVTSIIGDKYTEMWKLTGPTIEAYADKVGADLLTLQSNPHHLTAHWVKFALHEITKDMYSRALWLDADLIVRGDAPDLFEMVPPDKLGVFNEGKFTPRAVALYEAMHKYGVVLTGWDRRSYYNTGVMLISQEHRHLFNDPLNVNAQMTYGFGEQTYVNVRIIQRKVPVYELPYQCNRMSIMDGITGVSRLAGYFVHYAGYPTEGLVDIIKGDLLRWEVYEGNYDMFETPALFINISGGLGDQVCAEPTLRYMREKLYPEARIYATSTYPELFTHIEGVEVSSTPPVGKFDAVHNVEIHPGEGTNFNQYSLHMMTHPVDYISMQALKRILPMEDKRITLPLNQAVVTGWNELVLVHPGQGWPSKTFPTEWWQAVIDRLVAAGHKVGVIGKDLQAAGITPDSEHTYIPVECPEGVVDLRDKLSTLELCALLEVAPVLITNDSAPLHLAGAYDNYIVLIPTCKHPEHLLPFRHGSQWWRAVALYNRLACDDYGFRPTDPSVRSIQHLVHPIEEYLPDPQDVVNTVTYLLNSEAEMIPSLEEQELKGEGNDIIIQPNE
jgi:hypothetical protein